MSVGVWLTIAVIAGALLVVVTRRQDRGARVDRLYEAAATGDPDRLREVAGRSVDRRDQDGNTALHLAYYRGRQEAIDALVAFGADDNLRNKEHLLPVEMREMAEIEALLTRGARCLDPWGGWRDPVLGREVYDRLTMRKPRIFNPALVRCVVTGAHQTQLVHLAIKLGIFRSEDKLAEVLRGYGTEQLATDYLNSGSPVLRAAAEVWARRHGYAIYQRLGAGAVYWGRF